MCTKTLFSAIALPICAETDEDGEFVRVFDAVCVAVAVVIDETDVVAVTVLISLACGVTEGTFDDSLVSENNGDAVIVPQSEGLGVAGEDPVTVVDDVAVNVPNDAEAVPEIALDGVALAVFVRVLEVDSVEVVVAVTVIVSVDFELVVEDEEDVVVGEGILDVEDELEGEEVSDARVDAVVEGVANAESVIIEVDVGVTVYDIVPIELCEGNPLTLLAPE